MPSHHTSWRFISISSSNLRLGLPSGLFPSGFPTKTLYTPVLKPIRAIRPAHIILLDFITRTILGEQYRSLSYSLCSFLHSPVTSSLLHPTILPSTLFSNNLSLGSSFNVSDQVSYPYKKNRQNYNPKSNLIYKILTAWAIRNEQRGYYIRSQCLSVRLYVTTWEKINIWSSDLVLRCGSSKIGQGISTAMYIA